MPILDHSGSQELPLFVADYCDPTGEEVLVDLVDVARSKTLVKSLENERVEILTGEAAISKLNKEDLNQRLFAQETLLGKVGVIQTFADLIYFSCKERGIECKQRFTDRSERRKIKNFKRAVRLARKKFKQEKRLIKNRGIEPY